MRRHEWQIVEYANPAMWDNVANSAHRKWNIDNVTRRPNTVTDMTTTNSFAEAGASGDIDRALDDLVDHVLRVHPPSTTATASFLGARFDAGLAWVHFPRTLGGLDLEPRYQARVELRFAEAGAPAPMMLNPMGVGMAAPTILTHGSLSQQKRYLRPLFAVEETWCQLFSEPTAGSDLASLAMSATQDGDEWIVDGQKVWTSLAHRARWGLLLVRTDPEVSKHKGLSYFILDMQAPGVEVRSLRQMTGEAEFNEVFLDEVRIPNANRLGEINGGWQVAITTLMNERVSIGEGQVPRASRNISRAVALWKQRAAANDLGSGALKDELMRLWILDEVNRLTNLRASNLRVRGVPGPEGSVAKLGFAEINQRITDLCVRIMGPAGCLYGSYDLTDWRPDTFEEREPPNAFLRSQANSIEGGTSQILRNILGERVLGLPGEPRLDKDVPWVQVPRN
jgi:alkylation response protein AidB-like acyl-CoA dehydrogenase